LYTHNFFRTDFFNILYFVEYPIIILYSLFLPPHLSEVKFSRVLSLQQICALHINIGKHQSQLHLVAHTVPTISYIGIILYSRHSPFKLSPFTLYHHTHPIRSTAIEKSLIIYTTGIYYTVGTADGSCISLFENNGNRPSYIIIYHVYAAHYTRGMGLRKNVGAKLSQTIISVKRTAARISVIRECIT